MKVDGFLIAIAAAIGLALLWPQIGTSDGPLHLAIVTQIGIAAVFFLHGAALSPQALRVGASNWRLHMLVQGVTYGVFPIIGFGLWFACDGILPDATRLGFVFLCALSSTISSSVAMTALARGNVPAAIFNATLSSLIGMVMTPVLVGLVARVTAGPSILDAIGDIVLLLLAPFALGQAFRSLIGNWIAGHKRWTSVLDRGVIVLLIYASFSDSTASGLWHRFSVGQFTLIGMIAFGLLLLALTTTTLLSRRSGFSREDEAVAVFCGSKKSLANGVPIAGILFAGNPAAGMILLPLLLYHQIQLIVCAALARRYAQRADD